MESILRLEKEEIVKLLRKIIIDTNVWAFHLEEEVANMDPARMPVLNLQLNEMFGFRQASGIKKMGLITGSGLDAVEQALSYSHWMVLENLRTERPDRNTLRFGTVDCTVKRAMDALGRKMDCSETGLKIRRRFVEVIDPMARVTRIFSAADEDKRGTDYTCLWEVKLDGQ